MSYVVDKMSFHDLFIRVFHFHFQFFSVEFVFGKIKKKKGIAKFYFWCVTFDLWFFFFRKIEKAENWEMEFFFLHFPDYPEKMENFVEKRF